MNKGPKPASPTIRKPHLPAQVIVVLLSLLLGACAAPTAAPPATPDPRTALETMVAATLQSAVEATASAPAPLPQPSPTLAPTPVDPATFEENLREALYTRNFADLPPLLADPFAIGLWQSEGITLPAGEAVNRLRTDLLHSKAAITFSSELPAEVEASDPPGLTQVRRLYSSGWGADGLGQAVLTLAQGPDGHMAWQSLVFTPIGFNPTQPAALEGIINVASANLRSGPSPLHTLVAPYAMGTPMRVSYAAPGFRWGKVTAPDGKEGWLLLSLLDLDAEPATLPLFPGTPSDSIAVIGWVEGGSGQPVDQAVVALWKQETDEVRPLAYSGLDGMFYLYLPADSTGSWTAAVVSVDCASSVMDEQCAKQSEFVQLTQPVALPPTGPVVFVYNNLMGDTPPAAAEGCPAAKPGLMPLSNTQDGYCLLFPEGFTIRQPATNLLELAGPALDQQDNPLAARVTVQKKPLPGGSSLETVAGALWSEARGGFSQNPITIGGEPGFYADHLASAGAVFQVRQIVVIHLDSYYILTFTPFDDADPYAAALPDQQKAWDSITTSFRFLE